MTAVYLYESLGDTLPVSFFGGGTLVNIASNPDQRKFPVASVSSGSGGNLGDGTEAVDWRVALSTDADRVAFRVDAGGTVLDRYRFIVNGAYLDEAEPAAVNGGRRWLVLDLGPGTHEVAIESYGDRPLIGFAVPSGASVSPVSSGPRALVLGDSFISGTGAGNQADNVARVFGDTLGIRDLWASGLDGTGYVADAGGTRYALDARASTDIARMQALGDIDLVLLSAGNSDLGLGDLTAPANGVFDTVRTLCPDALIFVTLPWNTAAPAVGTSLWQTAKTELEAAVDGRDGVYLLDTEVEAYSKADGTHPDTAGHASLGAWLAAQVTSELTS